MFYLLKILNNLNYPDRTFYPITKINLKFNSVAFKTYPKPHNSKKKEKRNAFTQLTTFPFKHPKKNFPSSKIENVNHSAHKKKIQRKN